METAKDNKSSTGSLSKSLKQVGLAHNEDRRQELSLSLPKGPVTWTKYLSHLLFPKMYISKKPKLEVQPGLTLGYSFIRYKHPTQQFSYCVKHSLHHIFNLQGYVVLILDIRVVIFSSAMT